MSTSRALCIIPAKLGSTRLKEKNLLPILGVPALGRVIEAAADSGVFGDDVFVSTESERVKEVAEAHGAQVPYLRPAELASDPYGTIDVIQHFFDTFPAYKEYDFLGVVLPTCPLMIAEDVSEAFKRFQNGNFGVVISMVETMHSAYRNFVFTDDSGAIEPLFPDMIPKKSQELPGTYRNNGAITFIRVQDILEHKKFFIDPVGAYVMPYERSIDIDTETDYNLATFFATQNQEQA